MRVEALWHHDVAEGSRLTHLKALTIATFVIFVALFLGVSGKLAGFYTNSVEVRDVANGELLYGENCTSRHCKNLEG